LNAIVHRDPGDESDRSDPRPPRRTKATLAEWKRLRQQKLAGKTCRVCDEPAETLHHLVPKSLGGDDVANNLVGVCGSGTTGCHGLVEARNSVACRALGDALTSDELSYVLARKGPVFLERYFYWKERAA